MLSMEISVYTSVEILVWCSMTAASRPHNGKAKSIHVSVVSEQISHTFGINGWKLEYAPRETF
jgi:hypothetical protein